MKKTRVILVLMLFLLLLTNCSPRKASENRIELQTPTKHADDALIIDPALEYENTMEFLDRKAEEVDQERKLYWKDLETSSLSGYQESIQTYRKDFTSMIGIPKECLTRLSPRLVSDQYVKTVNDVEIRYWTIAVCDSQLMQFALVGIPKAMKEKLPLVIAIHGTCGSPELVMGLAGDDYHHSFGLRLAEEGYFVFAPLITTLSTHTNICQQPTNAERNQLDHRALPLGDRLLGIEVGKMMGSIDYLSGDEKINDEEIGVYGISLGGQLAFFTGAADERVEVTVVSQYIEDRKEKLVDRDYETALWHYEYIDYNLLPQSLKYFTDIEIAFLIVPRKLFIEVGRNDPRSSGTERLLPEFAEAYTGLGLPANFLGSEIADGTHEIFLRGSLKFLDQWLKEAKQ